MRGKQYLVGLDHPKDLLVAVEEDLLVLLPEVDLDRRSPAAARCHQPSHLHERNGTMGFRKVSKRFAPTCTVVGWAMEGFGKRVAVARDRDAPMGMISPFCAARLPGPTARTLASLICGHDRGKTRKCQCGMDRRRRLGPTIGGRRLGDCSVGAPVDAPSTRPTPGG